MSSFQIYNLRALESLLLAFPEARGMAISSLMVRNSGEKNHRLDGAKTRRK